MNPGTAIVNPVPDECHLLSFNFRLDLSRYLHRPCHTFEIQFLIQNLLDEEAWHPEFSRRQIDSVPAGPGRTLYGGFTLAYWWGIATCASVMSASSEQVRVCRAVAVRLADARAEAVCPSGGPRAVLGARSATSTGRAQVCLRRLGCRRVSWTLCASQTPPPEGGRAGFGQTRILLADAWAGGILRLVGSG
jgi:hypothetical protein